MLKDFNTLLLIVIFICVICVLTSCTQKMPEDERRDINKLAECVCSSKGGVSYIRYFYHRATTVCHGSDQTYDIYRDDYCKQ